MGSKPIVRLVAAFPHPLDTAVAAARTCTSSAGPIVPEAVAAGAAAVGEAGDTARERRDALARSLYAAGHHTTFQHAHFLFVLERVSRQFVWSFLHAHPFANSEQVSQRYVKVSPDAVFIPEMGGPEAAAFAATVATQHEAYRRLVELLSPVAEAELLARFPNWRRHPKRLARQTERKAQEVARAVLPVATHTSLLHTVSCLTLFRYRRLCNQLDVPSETRLVVDAMVAAALARDPDLAGVLEDPIPLEATPEYALYAEFHGGAAQPAAFREEFDRDLGGLTSKLLGGGRDNVETVARAVRAVLGLPASRLASEEAVRLALDPGVNRLLGEDLNLSTLSKLGRCLHHAHYTFAKKLSHAAEVAVELLSERGRLRRPAVELGEQCVLGRRLERDRVLEHTGKVGVAGQRGRDHRVNYEAGLGGDIELVAEPPVAEQRQARDGVQQRGVRRHREHRPRDLLRLALGLPGQPLRVAAPVGEAREQFRLGDR